jgi:hypothetical protein
VISDRSANPKSAPVNAPKASAVDGTKPKDASHSLSTDIAANSPMAPLSLHHKDLAVKSVLLSLFSVFSPFPFALWLCGWATKLKHPPPSSSFLLHTYRINIISIYEYSQIMYYY